MPISFSFSNPLIFRLAALLRRKMLGPVNQMGHLHRCVDRQRMLRVSGSRQDAGSHISNGLELRFGRLGEERDHDILQRYHPDAKLNQIGI